MILFKIQEPDGNAIEIIHTEKGLFVEVGDCYRKECIIIPKENIEELIKFLKSYKEKK